MMASEVSGSALPPSTPNNNGASVSGKSNASPKGSKMSVSDFVSASFARFEAEYGPSTLVEVSAGAEASRLLASRHAANNTDNTATKHTIDEDGNKENNDGSSVDEEEEEEPFWSLLLTLYLPLILFGLRRSTFGTFSFVRTVLLGHVLRLLISVILFSIPASFSESFDKWWGKVVQIYWVQHILWAVTGDDRYHPNKHSGSISHYQCFNEGSSLAGLSVGSVPVNSGSRKGFNPDHVWPPPALTLLTLITVVAFVVHPDGLTWIIMGKFVDGVIYIFHLICFSLVMLRDEPIHTVAAAASLSGIVLLGGLIHRTLAPKANRNSSRGEDGGLSASSRKAKKGKKGRNGRQGHHNTARGRAKSRGGHFRSSKNLYDSPSRQRSRSRSLSRSEANQNNESEVSQAVDAVTSKDIDGDNSQQVLVERSRNPVESSDSKTAHSQPHISLSKLRPYSVDSSLPQLSDDVSSCSSIAGSLIDVPGSKPLKCVLEDADKNVNRRKSKHGPKRGRNSSSAGKHHSAPQQASTRAPPGFIANDPTMTPSRVSPLAVSNPSSSPYKGGGSTTISPVRRAISRPTPPTAKTSYGYSPQHHVPRARASTSDGIVKPSYSAPVCSNDAPSGNSIQTHTLNQPPGIVRYGLPDYSAYAQNDSRYDPRKIELAAFLARVGLVGSACADLLKDLFDVDALAALTPEQLYKYNIGTEKQVEIAALLKARELRLMQQRLQQMPAPTPAPTPVIRPPPGLGFSSPVSDSGVAALQKTQVSPITRPLYQARSLTPDLSSDLILSSPLSSTHGNDGSRNFTLQSLRSSVDNSIFAGNVADPMMQGSFHLNNSNRLPPIGSRLFSSANHAQSMQSDDEKIDADLQQLGDRMVGSVLDF